MSLSNLNVQFHLFFSHHTEINVPIPGQCIDREEHYVCWYVTDKRFFLQNTSFIGKERPAISLCRTDNNIKDFYNIFVPLFILKLLEIWNNEMNEYLSEYLINKCSITLNCLH